MCKSYCIEDVPGGTVTFCAAIWEARSDAAALLPFVPVELPAPTVTVDEYDDEIPF